MEQPSVQVSLISLKARAVILGLDDEPVVKATIPECYNIQAVSAAATGMSKLYPIRQCSDNCSCSIFYFLLKQANK